MYEPGSVLLGKHPTESWFLHSVGSLLPWHAPDALRGSCSRDLGPRPHSCCTLPHFAVQIGYYAMPYESITAIAHGYVTVGICTSQLRDHAASYAHWIRKERVFTPAWKTFSVGDWVVQHRVMGRYEWVGSLGAT